MNEQIIKAVKPRVTEQNYSVLKKDSTLESIWKIPNLPLTEAFGAYDPQFPTFNQEVMMCSETGHVQLRFVVDPDFLYSTENYNFVTLPTIKINTEINYLLEKLKIRDQISINSKILEIGGNNLQIANLLKGTYKKYVVCDPILENEVSINGDPIDTWGDLLENVMDRIDDLNPTLVIGRHILEHVVSPRDLLLEILSRVSNETVFCFEVPSYDHLTLKMRFDAFFHQHLSYFDEFSIRYMVESIGCQILNLEFNPDGSNGGSLLFSFKKKLLGVIDSEIISNEKFDSKIEIFLQNLNSYSKQMQITNEILNSFKGQKLGFGAGLMLATYNYHLSGGCENLEAILDDDMEKNGLSYKNLDVPIIHPTLFDISKKSLMLITSLENQVTIRTRIKQFPGAISLGLNIH
jgi:hypothetical protein